MLRINALRAAVEEFTAAALLGDGLEPALSHLSCAGGARGATLLVGHGPKVASIVATEEVSEPVADFMAGRAPPSSRQRRLAEFAAPGFRIDQDDYTREELATEPFYQEFLRPLGYFWHANVALLGDYEEHIALSLKRSFKLDPYGREDVAVLNMVVPDLRAAARIFRGVLNSQAAGMAGLLQHRGDPVFELDSRGRVLRTHSTAGTSCEPVRVVGTRLAAVDRLAQPGLDAAVAAATREPRRPSVAVVPDHGGTPHYLQVFPVPGRARDIFLASVAVGVLIKRGAPRKRSALEPMILRTAFSLTDREGELASLIGQGLDLAEIARLMNVQIGTARNHLKSVFEKTGTRRQGELAALLARLHP